MASRRNILLLGGVAAGAYFLWPKQTISSNPFETQGVRNVGNAFATGGGTTTHTPGVATTRGDSTANTSPQEQMKGVGTAHFDDKHAAQKVGEPGAIEKAYRGAHSGNEKGK
ncbi:hypothetical protein AMS68_006438 [Peltaster fructicola]|uniref:Uncharacterized protein n=1 Tax=Peltaster fructicola TaxID=286661 RepID=A0A6H0Y1X0_9PEZI|nr:hypothetical protein AMS68_006438 [Peltaster fructicola]